MKQIVPFKKELSFKTKVSEITSISLEREINVEEEGIIAGVFHITGNYKMNEGSINREEFSFDANISIAIQDIEALNLDNLYQIIVEVFEWIYRKKMNLDNIERIEIIKKLEKLLEKYEKDV